MSYVANNLLSNEKIVYYTRPHWVIFLPGIGVFVLALLFVIYGPRLLFFNTILYSLHIYQIASLVCIIIGICALLSSYIRYQTSEYAVTNKRILMKTGLIRRDSLELFLDKIEALHVDQSVSGRILGFGSIGVVGTGGTRDIFSAVPHPLRFRKVTQQQIDGEVHMHPQSE